MQSVSVASRLLSSPGVQPLAASTRASRLQSALTFSTFAYLKFNQGPRCVVARRLRHFWEEAADSRPRSSSFIPAYPALVLLPRARLPRGEGREGPVGNLCGVVRGSLLNTLPGSLRGGGGHVSSSPRPLGKVRTTPLRRSSLIRDDGWSPENLLGAPLWGVLVRSNHGNRRAPWDHLTISSSQP